MAPSPSVMQAVERLGYRVTVGDVAAQAGLNVNLAQRELLALASDAGGNLQVAESGEIAYQFPKNFRVILRNKFLKLRLQEWGKKIWQILFYLIRISFGIVLLLSIVLIFVAIAAILIALNSSRGDSDRDNGYSGGGGGMVFLPNFWFGPNWFWFFDPNPYRHYPQGSHREQDPASMNFLEAIYSFLFGDGNPNADLEDRRWRTIGAVIRNNRGAVVAEQIAPYLDIPEGGQADEDYMLPVLSKFDGRPEVSPEGEIVYHFPQLQSTATQQRSKSIAAYLRELPWRFSQATSGQKMLAIALGSVNLVGALVLGYLLSEPTVTAGAGAFIAFVQSIFAVLLAYGVAFLAIPLVRFFWIQWQNKRIEARNEQRRERAILLNQADPVVQHKIAYAQQFAAETVINRDNLAYTTEESLLEQESERSAAIDAEWQRHLDQSSSS